MIYWTETKLIRLNIYILYIYHKTKACILLHIVFDSTYRVHIAYIWYGWKNEVVTAHCLNISVRLIFYRKFCFLIYGMRQLLTHEVEYTKYNGVDLRFCVNRWRMCSISYYFRNSSASINNVTNVNYDIDLYIFV